MDKYILHETAIAQAIQLIDEEMSIVPGCTFRYAAGRLLALEHALREADRRTAAGEPPAVDPYVTLRRQAVPDVQPLLETLQLQAEAVVDSLNALRKRVAETSGALAKSNGATLIAAERIRQIEDEGYDALHDDCQETKHEMLRAALCYLTSAPGAPEPFDWPWQYKHWKPGPDRKRMLVKAAALIAAEIDQMERQEKGG